jgi:putative flavoprotein involved in K+ transport
MSRSILDVIVVGAGQTGLSASYFLKQKGMDHLVFERGKVAETWRSQRWDSFQVNTANKLNLLPGADLNGFEPDEFATGTAFASSLKLYADTFQLPVVEDAIVVSVEKPDDTDYFDITVSIAGEVKHYYCGQIVIASGEMNKGKIPECASRIGTSIVQLHAKDYRNADYLPSGSVLVVGSAQSGCQIAEDLIMAGRNVYLATSMVARMPRRYRGRDILDWLLQMKFFDARKEDIKDPVMLNLKPPQITGKGDGTRTISLQSLAKLGVTILGRLENADEQKLYFQDNAAMHVQFADQFSANIKNSINGFIEQNQLSAPDPVQDENDMPDLGANCASNITVLQNERISSIVWATGFEGDFSYIKLPVFDTEGNPVHKNGIAPVEGLYFLGLHWLRSRGSVLIHGAGADAEFICSKIFEKHGQSVAQTKSL